MSSERQAFLGHGSGQVGLWSLDLGVGGEDPSDSLVGHGEHPKFIHPIL